MNVISVDDHKIISPNDPDWTEHVLSHLKDHELKDGNPTVDGLRRVTGLIYGDIIVSRTKLLEVPDSNYEKCTASHTLAVERYVDGKYLEVSAVVDVRYKKTERPYNEYLVATADTRAEGKALRRLLKLSIVTAEELSEKDEDEVDLNTFINDNQISVIAVLSKRLDINAALLIKRYVKEPIKNVREVPYHLARNILSDLGHYQRHTQDIPAEVVGFQENWRDNINVKSKRTRKSKTDN